MTFTNDTCDCEKGHTAACRQRKHRARKGRKPQGYVVTAEDRAAIEKVSAADRLPDWYFQGKARITINEEEIL